MPATISTAAAAITALASKPNSCAWVSVRSGRVSGALEPLRRRFANTDYHDAQASFLLAD
jgi:hypothetical protein